MKSSRDHALPTTDGHGALPMPSLAEALTEIRLAAIAYRLDVEDSHKPLAERLVRAEAVLKEAANRIEEPVAETELLRTERDEAAFRASEYWKPILRHRDEWIVELIRERDAAVADGTSRAPSPPVTSDAVPGTNPSYPKGQDQ